MSLCRWIPLTLIIALLLPVSATAASAEADELLGQGLALAQEGKVQEALVVYQQAVELAPDSAAAHFRLGGMQVVTGDYAGSIASFQTSITLDGNNADAFIGMAIAYIHQGKDAHASAALNEASRIDPSKKPKIDEVQAWLATRSAGASGAEPPAH